MVTAILLAVLNLPSYEDAYKKSTTEGIPLVVVVGAEWCGPCRQVKAELPKLKNCAITYVDIDKRPELAKLLMDGNKIPQVVVYGKGKRLRAIGLQTLGRIEEMVDRTR